MIAYIYIYMVASCAVLVDQLILKRFPKTHRLTLETRVGMQSRTNTHIYTHTGIGR
jgi:hypothetical protein